MMSSETNDKGENIMCEEITQKKFMYREYEFLVWDMPGSHRVFVGLYDGYSEIPAFLQAIIEPVAGRLDIPAKYKVCLSGRIETEVLEVTPRSALKTAAYLLIEYVVLDNWKNPGTVDRLMRKEKIAKGAIFKFLETAPMEI